jgi:hypothetical protein
MNWRGMGQAMPSTDSSAIRFVRALLPEHTARLVGEHYELERIDRVVRLGKAEVAALCELGVLVAGAGLCRIGPRARAWLDSYRRPMGKAPDIAPLALRDIGESPLARLAAGPEAYLLAHHVEAGERLRRLVERARLGPRVTMSYDPARIGGGGHANIAGEISDTAVEARQKLDAIARSLPADCAGVLFDVCGLLKGLQVVESERGWPRRSAKLVLRIALEELARHFGLVEMAKGGKAPVSGWREGRLPLEI